MAPFLHVSLRFYQFCSVYGQEQGGKATLSAPNSLMPHPQCGLCKVTSPPVSTGTHSLCHATCNTHECKGSSTEKGMLRALREAGNGTGKQDGDSAVPEEDSQGRGCLTLRM